MLRTAEAGTGKPGEHVLAAEAAFTEGKQMQRRAAGNVGRQGHYGGPVRSSYAAGGQLLVRQPAVRFGAGVEDGDPVPFRPVPH